VDITRRTRFVYALIALIWALVITWQAVEHARVRETAQMELRNRSREIASTVSAFVRGLRFRGTVLQDRLLPVLEELIHARTNQVLGGSELLSIALLNVAGEPVAAAGQPLDLRNLKDGEDWREKSVVLANIVDLGSKSAEGGTNPTVVLPGFQELTNTFRGDGRPDRRPPPEGGTNTPPGPPPESQHGMNPPPDDGKPPEAGRPPDSGSRSRRPPWFRGMDEAEYQKMIARRTLHGLVLALSTESVDSARRRDLWMRSVICVLATLAALGTAFAWRNLTRTSDLQIRLVRASELNSHLREMNLAAAGLAHETRNPLNLIRGRAHMISKREDTAAEIRQTSREIIEEADKVAAQLNEFINYSRPREVRRNPVALATIVQEVVRALNYDIEEKQVQVQLQVEPVTIEADEQLLRQALFNLLINGIQAVNAKGEIRVATSRMGTEAVALSISDNGPGVPPEKRQEIFKPYVTTTPTGTGLGLAVVQQIALAHGWDVVCEGNDPAGAVFRLSPLRLTSAAARA
jgi:signal transduction histidine kinase